MMDRIRHPTNLKKSLPRKMQGKIAPVRSFVLESRALPESLV